MSKARAQRRGIQIPESAPAVRFQPDRRERRQRQRLRESDGQGQGRRFSRKQRDRRSGRLSRAERSMGGGCTVLRRSFVVL